jgi:hypothetical protein
MFRFVFSKKPTIFLLLAIIVISLIFSVILQRTLQEGIDDTAIDATINNPPPEIINKIDVVLKDESKNKLEKLSAIKDLLKNKYKVLGDIYRQNESAVLKELTSTLSNPPKRDNDGKLFDPEAMIGENRDKAVKILSSNDYSAMEKIEKIKSLAGKDKTINIVMDEFVDAWLKMVITNIEQIRTTMNDVVKPIPSP